MESVSGTQTVKFRLFILLLTLSLPGLAQVGVEPALERENARLDLLLEWSPGQSQPVLPPLVPYIPDERPEPPSKPVPRPNHPKSTAGRDFTGWILSYNRSLSLIQAQTLSKTIVLKAEKHRLDASLVVALVAAESAFRSDARSPVGAQGLGQLMPGTAAMLGVQNPFDPIQNLEGTAIYLSRQLRRFGSSSLALAAYNAGPGAVQKYGGIPPYRETQEYVAYVLKLHRQLKKLDHQSVVITSQNTEMETKS